MAGEFNGTILDSRAGCVDMLRNLSREELLEILSEELCQNCDTALQKRIQSFTQRKLNDISISNDKESASPSKFSPTESPSSESSTATWACTRTPESIYARPQGNFLNSSPVSTNNKRRSFNPKDYEILLNDGLSKATSGASDVIDEEEKERIRFAQVNAKKDFAYTEKVNGRSLNVLQGLELHTRVFNTEEQKKIVESVYNLQKMGQKGELSARTYSEPRKWMRGKGRITMQFGCCYNYAVDKDGNPPGIVRDEEVDPLPPVFKQMIKRMVRWRVLPSSCVPNSCIVNIYDEGDCIPPHIDHHDFVRPFCTVSFLTECNILFGSNLKILSPGEFSGPVSIPLPVGSVLILNGNGADVAKHCVPGVPSKRISITFRKMDESKSPYWYSPDPELQGIKPLSNSPLTKSLAAPIEDRSADKRSKVEESRLFRKTIADALIMNKDEFPPLGRASFGNQQRNKRNGGS